MSELIARCTVDGIPAPQGSKRAFAIPGKGGRGPRAVVVDDNKVSLRSWRADVRNAGYDQAGGCFVESAPLMLIAFFRFPRQKSAKRSAGAAELAITKPDLDKLARAILDALTSVWFRDDALIVDLVVSKRVCEIDQRPGVDIELWTIQDEPKHLEVA
jgi:Holliday junction resolvase RusA-like endonuclease